MKPTLKILTVDDHPLYAEGISACLQKLPLVKQVDSCTGYDDLHVKLKIHQPHLVFLELNLQQSKEDAFAICREITKRHLHIFVVMLSHNNDRELIQRAQASGAGAYFDKRNSTEALYEFMDDLCNGCINHFYVKVVNDDQLQLPVERHTLDLKQLLTRKELEVMNLIVKGTCPQEISDTLHVLYATFMFHHRNLLEKLGLKNDVQLTRFAFANQLTDHDFKVTYKRTDNRHKEIIPDLDREEFKKRINEHLPIVYFLMIGIVQGVAFHMLVATIFEEPAHLNLNSYLHLGVTFLNIVTATYIQIVIVGLLRWNMGSRDLIFIMVVGLCEIAPVWFHDNPRNWWLSFGAYCFATGSSFSNIKLVCAQSMFASHKNLYEKTINVLDESIALLVLSIFWSVVFALMYLCPVLGETSVKIANTTGLISAVIILLFFMKRYHRFYVDFHEEFGYTVEEKILFPSLNRASIAATLFNGFVLLPASFFRSFGISLPFLNKTKSKSKPK